MQKPPFPDPHLLAAQDPQGECLDLTEYHSTDSPVFCCLPGGTGLAVADLSPAPEKLSRAYAYGDQNL